MRAIKCKQQPKINLNKNHNYSVTKDIRIFSLNVGGLSTKYDLGILEGIIKNNDITCLYETKTNFIDNFHISDYRIIEMPIKNPGFRLGGIHGICLYVKNDIDCEMDEMSELTCSESIFWWKIKV